MENKKKYTNDDKSPYFKIHSACSHSLAIKDTSRGIKSKWICVREHFRNSQPLTLNREQEKQDREKMPKQEKKNEKKNLNERTRPNKYKARSIRHSNEQELKKARTFMCKCGVLQMLQMWYHTTTVIRKRISRAIPKATCRWYGGKVEVGNTAKYKFSFPSYSTSIRYWKNCTGFCFALVSLTHPMVWLKPGEYTRSTVLMYTNSSFSLTSWLG